MQVFSYGLARRKPSGRKIPTSSKHFANMLYTQNTAFFMKHFKSSTSVVVEVSAQQFFVHLQFCQFVFLHKTKVNALKHREALNTLLLKSTNTTTLLQYSCGRERRGVVLGLCNDMNALAHDSQLECVGKMCQVICH